MKKLILSAILLLANIHFSILFAQGYQLDPSFDGDGIKVINSATMDMFGDYVNTWDEAHCVAVDANDKILVGGLTGSATIKKNFVVYRYNEDGTPDNSFGNSGKAIVNVDVEGGVATSIKVMPDGKILVAGYAFDKDEIKQIVLVRLNANGILDTSFGTNGFSKSTPVAGNSLSLWMNDLLIGPDGKIVITAFVYEYEYYVFHYLRFNSNGTFDTTLDSDGMYVKGSKFQSFGSTFDESGNLMVLGVYEGRKGLLRLGSDGGLDSAFATHGVAAVENLVPRGVFNKNSNITIGGELTGINGSNLGIKLKRFDQLGNPDLSFGGNGEVAFEYYVNGLPPWVKKVKNVENKILLVGNKSSNSGSGLCESNNAPCYTISVPNSSQDFWILALNEDGTVDNSFGTSGTQIIPVSTTAEDEVFDVTIDSQGRVIAVGYVNSSSPYFRDIAIVRLASTTTGTASSEKSSKLSVYPNPGNGIFNLNLHDDSKPSEIRVINSQGMEIKKMTSISYNSIELDLSDQPAGIYMVEVIEGEKVERVKLVKE